MMVRKRITVTIAEAGEVSFLYSNAQPHNEVIYDMKTRWAPRMEQDPKAFVGREFPEPYDSYLARHRGPLLWRYLLLALLPVMVVVAAVGWRRHVIS